MEPLDHTNLLSEAGHGDVTVLLVCDKPVLAAGVRAALGIDARVAAADQSGWHEALAREEPQIVLVDGECPDLDIGALAAELSLRCPEARLMLFTRPKGAATFRQWLKQGLRGLVSKKATEAEIAKAVRSVAADVLYIDTSLAIGLFEQDRPRSDTSTPGLSAREEAVLRLLAWGLTDKEIAFRLAISIKSVGTYKHRAAAKLHLVSRAEIVRHAVRAGWLKDEDDDDARISEAG